MSPHGHCYDTRLPTPEGLAPTDPAILDEHLDRLIQTYTLVGTPILVHCRGGVGRAGVVACCWALKLGLCGWIETQPTSSSETGMQFVVTTTAPALACPSSQLAQRQRSGSDADDDDDSASGADADLAARETVRRDTMQLVERAIALVRRRRSAKAVETFEQVKFLVEYVDFLRTKKANNFARAHECGTERGGGGANTLLLPSDALPASLDTDTLNVAVDIASTELKIGSVMASDIRTHP